MTSTYFFIALILSSLFSIVASATTLKIALDSEPISLDPHEHLTENTLQTSHLLFDPLIRWTKDNTLEPRLAKAWQQIDERTTRFILRENVVFHSGNAFSAKDVIFTLQRLKRSPDFKGLFDNIASLKEVDELTLDIITKKPTPLLLNLMTYVFPMDSQFYQGKDDILKFGKSFASRHVSGTGPFVITHREQGKRVDFARFPSYWDKSSEGNLEKIELTPIKSNSTRLAALLSNDVDFIHPIAPLDIVRIKRTQGVDLVTLLTSRILLLQLNQSRREEFKNVKVRQAINLAINQEVIVNKILKKFSKAAGQLSSEQFMGHDKDLTPKYDLQQAKKLMQEAGYQDGFRVSMITSNGQSAQIAQAIESMLAKINIQVDLKALPKAQYYKALDDKNVDILLMSWLSDTQDSNNLFEFLVACPNKITGLGSFNANGYCNPVIDNMIADANEELNVEKRKQILQAIERKLAQEAVVIPLAWLHLAWAAKSHIQLESVVNTQNVYYLGDLKIDE